MRVYLDESQEAGRWSKAKELLAGGCEIKFEDGPGLMHNKFVVIDGRVCLITGSYNWTRAAEEKNDENMLIIRNERTVQMLGEKFGG